METVERLMRENAEMKRELDALNWKRDDGAVAVRNMIRKIDEIVREVYPVMNETMTIQDLAFRLGMMWGSTVGVRDAFGIGIDDAPMAQEPT